MICEVTSVLTGAYSTFILYFNFSNTAVKIALFVATLCIFDLMVVYTVHEYDKILIFF